MLGEVFPAEATNLFYLHGRLKLSGGKEILVASVRSINAFRSFCETSSCVLHTPVVTPWQCQKKMWHPAGCPLG